MANSSLAQELVEAMHKEAEAVHSFPWVWVGSYELPEPDLHGDDVAPLVAKVCSEAATAGLVLPAVCPSSASLAEKGSKGSKRSGAKSFRLAKKIQDEAPANGE